MDMTGKPSDPPKMLDDLLCFAIYSAGHAFNRVYKPLLDSLGLTYPQYLVMVALWSEDGQTVGSLGQKLFLESSTLTPLIKRLEAIGYLTRSRDPLDERQVRVRLSGTGLALRETARGIPDCIRDATGVSADALQSLKAHIAEIRENLLKASSRTQAVSSEGVGE